MRFYCYILFGFFIFFQVPSPQAGPGRGPAPARASPRPGVQNGKNLDLFCVCVIFHFSLFKHIMSTATSRGKCSKTSIVSQGRKKIHSSFEDGSEMIEEYDVNTDQLLVRKFREKTSLGQQRDWEFLVGEPVKKFNPDKDLLAESSQNPIFLRQDTAYSFCFRIRNLPYPKDVYSVEVDNDAQQIVVRTSNKKYYKRISLPDLKSTGEVMDASNLKWDHQNNTLIIHYAKSQKILKIEEAAAVERKELKSESADKDGDVDCKQQ